jgi:L-ascorbate metabolism protein UlaG (beta-lactamase superfamily)
MIDAWPNTGGTPRGTRLERMRRSPRYRDGRFANVLPDEKIRVASTAWAWLKGTDHRRPDAPVAVLERAARDFDTPPASGLRVTWLGHSTFLLEVDGRRLLTDPIWSRRSSPSSVMGPTRFFSPPLRLDDLPSIDAVLISHDHYDHLDRATVTALARRGVRFIAPLGVGAHLEAWGVAPDRVVELDWWEEARVDTLRIVATPARHFSGRSITRNRTLWAGLAIIGPSHRVFFSGDTAMFPELAEIGSKLGPFDVTMLDAGAYNARWRDVHLGPEQAVQAHLMLRGRLLIPAHWGTFALSIHGWTEPIERVLVAAASAGARVAAPRPGESVEPSAPPSLVRWWPTLPFRSAAEAPVVSSGLPARPPR